VTDLVYFLQAGDTDAVRIHHVSEARLRMHIGLLQAGNPQPLLLRALYTGDKTTAHQLHQRYTANRIYDCWFTADVLDQLPADLEAVPFDATDEQRKVARRALETLARSRA
jgi:hypothetical protein